MCGIGQRAGMHIHIHTYRQESGSRRGSAIEGGKRKACTTGNSSRTRKQSTTTRLLLPHKCVCRIGIAAASITPPPGPGPPSSCFRLRRLITLLLLLEASAAPSQATTRVSAPRRVWKRRRECGVYQIQLWTQMKRAHGGGQGHALAGGEFGARTGLAHRTTTPPYTTLALKSKASAYHKLRLFLLP